MEITDEIFDSILGAKIEDLPTFLFHPETPSAQIGVQKASAARRTDVGFIYRGSSGNSSSVLMGYLTPSGH